MRAIEWAYGQLASRKFTLLILGLLAALSMPGTFREGGGLYGPRLYGALLFFLALNLAVCTAKSLKILPRDVILIHAGALVTLAGGLVSSAGGFLATKNIYVGTAVDSAFEWGEEVERPLGFVFRVDDLEVDYYPLEIRVGVKDRTTGQKLALHQLRTGERFNAGEYTVLAGGFEFPAEEVNLSIFRGGRILGTCSTGSAEELPPGFPYEFVLVAYKGKPVVKRSVAYVSASGGRGLKSGTVSPNSPFEFGGTRFYMTNLNYDRFGIPYIGFQITRDPGRPIVLLGAALASLGLMAFARRLLRRGR